MSKKLLTISTLCLSLFFSAFSLNAQTAVARHGKLKTQGRYLLNEKNQIVQLRGMSFFWTTPGWNGTQWYNAATVDALVDTWKCTVVRLAFDTQSGWNDLCVPVLNRCIEKGIYVIIDWHSHNAETQESAAINFFKEQAKKYKNTPNVIFEPYNEPKWAGGAQAEVGDVTNAQKTWAAIKPYLKNVTKAIRAEGAENLVILGTPYYAQFVQVAADDPVKDDGNKDFTNVAYSFHFYAASHGNGAYYYSHADASGKKSGGMEPSYLAAAVGSVPIFITEWGTTHSDGGEGNKNTYIDVTNTDWWFENYVDKNHLSHCNWSATSFQPSSAFSGSATSTSASGAAAKKHIAVSTVDYWELPSTLGKEGPAKDSVFTMPPATHPAYGFNRYFGGSVSPLSSVPYALRDDIAARTSQNSAVSIAGGAKSDEWFEYWVKPASETKYILIRYLALKGTGTLDVMVDGTSKGSLALSATPDSVWKYQNAQVTVGAGDHKIRMRVSASTGEGFMVEWFELTNSITGIANPQMSVYSNELKLIRQANDYTIHLPEAQRYTHYTVFGIDGRAVRSAPISLNETTLSISNLTKGTWFLRLDNSTKNATYKLVF